jgi:hypothetical protein
LLGKRYRLCHNIAQRNCCARGLGLNPPAPKKSREDFMADVRVLATDLEFPEGPVAMPDGSVVAGRESAARRPDRGFGHDGRKEVVAKIPAARMAQQWAGRQMLHLQQWRVQLDSLRAAPMSPARPAPHEYIGGSIPAHRSADRPRSRRSSTGAASIR